MRRVTEDHPRDGYVVALFMGRIDARNLPVVLVEIVEQYRLDGVMFHHYRPYNAITGRPQEIKTIGTVDPFDPKTATEPPRFVMSCFKDLDWKRLR